MTSTPSRFYSEGQKNGRMSYCIFFDKNQADIGKKQISKEALINHVVARLRKSREMALMLLLQD
jgi:hypothetical protein